ncbi:hypothetical protein [Streptomyces graminilatus]|uniref:hypothetical protein n=1 Tax=Streptomyces graminilatus TaxID=1464070 RepID=UPI0006E263A8|nr:hypothetical protein [Streptomyces graminilatus]
MRLPRRRRTAQGVLGLTGKGRRAAGWGTGALLVLGSLAGCGGGDGKASAHAAATSAAVAGPTNGPGDYRPPTDLCPKVDFGPLTAAVAPKAGPAKGQRTGSDPAVSSGAACLQGFRTAGPKADGRSTVYCSAWKDVATAVKVYKYRLSSAPKEARGPVVREPGLGQGAFRYENVKEAAPFVNDLRLLVRDSNLECEVQVQSLKPLTDQHVDAALPAMAETVRTLLPKLRS